MKKALKIIGIAILIIIAVPLITALFVKKEYSVVQEVTINQPKQIVFDYAKLLKNQDEYSVWMKMDPNVEKTYKGTDGMAGFVSAWSSKNEEVGKGEQEIIAIKDGGKINYELRFLEPFESKSEAYMDFEELDSAKVKVQWGFKGKMDYPMNLMLLFMDMEGMIGKDLQGGLNNLKDILEN